MNDVDMLLRDTLRDRAEVAPAATSLLTRVRTRSRLLRRRRRAGVAGAGAAAVVLAAATVPVAVEWAGRDGGAPSGFGGPATSGSATREPVQSGPASGGPAPSRPTPPSVAPLVATLGPPQYTLPAFPFTPGPMPGLTKPVAGLDGDVYLMHSPDSPDAPSVQVFTGATGPRFVEGEPGLQAESTPIEVRGVTGTLRTESAGPDFVSRTLYWREASGAWIWVRATNMTPTAMLAYANSLQPGPVQIRAPFTFDLLPQGLALDNVGPSDMVFRQPGQPAGGTWESKLGFLLNADGGGDAASWPLRARGQPAKIHVQDQERSAWVLQPNGTILVIQVPQWLVISDDDLLRLAAGVHVATSAQAGRG
jgi:hypothetical protein